MAHLPEADDGEWCERRNNRGKMKAIPTESNQTTEQTAQHEPSASDVETQYLEER